MKVVKKRRGRKPSTTSFLLSGDRALDEIRLRGILLLNGKTPRQAADDLGVSESAISRFLRTKSRSARFFRYMEALAKLNNVSVQRTDLSS